LLGLTGKDDPRILLLPTAVGDSAAMMAWFYSALTRHRCRPSHATLFGVPPADLLLAQDVVLVGGGNTANMLAVWRVHGVDELLREAWERGIVLTGFSAGSICWFDAERRGAGDAARCPAPRLSGRARPPARGVWRSLRPENLWAWESESASCSSPSAPSSSGE
jgi:hypothetical protein